MVFIQLPIVGVSGTTSTLVPTYDATGTQTGTTTQIGDGPVKQVFPVPYFGKYHVKILGAFVNVNYAGPAASIGGLTLSSGSYEVYTFKSTVLNNPGSPCGFVAYLGGTSTLLPYPYDLGEFYINGFIDYEIGIYNPTNPYATPANFNTCLRSYTQTGTAPNLTANAAPTYHRYSVLTLELTKIDD